MEEAAEHQPELNVITEREMLAAISLSGSSVMGLVPNARGGTSVAHSWPLPMMPMRLDDVLLPGETSRLLLKEPAHLALLHAVSEKHDGQFGQLLQENGRCGSVAPILKIEAHAPPRLLDNDGLWVDVHCVGRVAIDDMVMSHDLPYDLALVTALVDELEDGPDVGMDNWMEMSPTATHAAGHVRREHEACHALSAKIKAVKAEEPGVSMPCAQCPRASNCDMMDEFHFSLPQLVGARREALLKPSAAASGPSGVKGPALWGQADEATAECQILSFAACSHLSAKTRRRALRTQDTTERLTLASGELRERQLEMCAELALRAAFP